jgi:hypothetical protein
MIIKSVRLYNFMHFEQVEIDIGEGVFFISGENRDETSSDSNGSGKSVFCQSIAWCLFDDILRKGVLKNGIIGPIDKWCMVSVLVEKDGQYILIKRYRNHPDFGHDVKIYIDGGEDKSKHKTEDSNKFIESLLGVNSKILYYCAYSDDDKEPFVALSPANLSKVVSEILDTGRFDKYLKEVKSLVKVKESEKITQESLLESDNRHIEVCHGDILNLESQIAEFDSDKSDRIKELRAKIKEIEVDISSQSELIEGKAPLIDKLSELRPTVDKVNLIRSEIVQLNRTKSNIEAELLQAEKRTYKISGDLRAVEESYDNIFNNMTGECRYCGNPLSISEKIDGKSESISKKRDTLVGELVLAEIDRDKVKGSLEKIVTSIKDLTDKEVEGREVVIQFNEALRQIGKIEEVETALKYLRDKLSTARTRLKEVQDSLPNALIKNKNEKQDYLEKLQTAKSERLDNIVSLDTEVEALKVLSRAISNTKSSIFNHFIISLQDKINDNLMKISEGDYSCTLSVKGEDCMLTFVKTSASDEGSSYHVFSKGERTRISKAVSVALNDMMGVGFYIDDEGLPGLDRSGVGHVLDFVLSITAANTLFFVSHDEAVRDYFRAYPNIHIIKERGKGTIELR